MAKRNYEDEQNLSVSEAGRKGGSTVSKKYDHLHFQAIGRLGGHKGGEVVAKRYGHDHFEEIGRKGGETVSHRYTHAHFEEIGHKGGQKVRELVERGKKAAADQT